MKTITQKATEAIGFAPGRHDDMACRREGARKLGIITDTSTLAKLTRANWSDLRMEGVTVLSDGTILKRASR